MNFEAVPTNMRKLLDLCFLRPFRSSKPLLADPLTSSTPNPIHGWVDDSEFNAIMADVRDHTLVDPVRCFILYQFALNAVARPGAFAEIGVYKGGTARLLSEVTKGVAKNLYLFDTFAGMPETDPTHDFHVAGDFSDTTLDAVKNRLAGYDQVHFYPGFFPETAAPVESDRFCFVHVDVDIYKSVLDCCEFFFKRLVPGGVMIFDDYGFVTCRGAKVAVDEFFSKLAIRPIYLPTGQCLVIRPE